jgi:hypothetical protein
MSDYGFIYTDSRLLWADFEVFLPCCAWFPYFAWTINEENLPLLYPSI